MSGTAISPDGKTIAAGFGDGTILLLDATSGEILKKMKVNDAHPFFGFEQLAFLPDGHKLASCDRSPDARKIRFWDTDTGQLLGVNSVDGIREGIAISPDGRMLVTGWESQLDGPIMLVWDLEMLLNGRCDTDRRSKLSNR